MPTFYAKLFPDGIGTPITAGEAAADAGTLLAEITSLTYPSTPLPYYGLNAVIAGPLLPGPGGFFEVMSARRMEGIAENYHYMYENIWLESPPMGALPKTIIVQYDSTAELPIGYYVIPGDPGDSGDSGDSGDRAVVLIDTSHRFAEISAWRIWDGGAPAAPNFWARRIGTSEVL